MFYKPKFCCNCGEKIERAQWGPFASRRFCEFCETEQKHHDYIFRGSIIAALFFGVLGVTGFFGSKPKPVNSAETARGQLQRPLKQAAPQPLAGVREVTSPASGQESSEAQRSASRQLFEQREKQPKTSTEATYFCGAITKKGTPCSRRLRSKGRCWQHLQRPSEPETE